MDIMAAVKAGFFYLDGGTGSLLQGMGLAAGEGPELWNLTHPEQIVALHQAYFAAGSQGICTNTFGVNSLKYPGTEGPSVEELISAGVNCAKTARERMGAGDRFIGLDIGPLGRVLSPFGDLPFQEAVDVFARTVKAGVAAGVDYIFIETMTDCWETKAALLAAKENSDLPVFVSNVFDESGKMMTGASPEAMVAMLEGMGADAIGMNCSLGPKQMLPLLERFAAVASVPLIFKPNAGMPVLRDGQTVYDIDPKEFAEFLRQAALLGARLLGGCCGSTPEYIRGVVEATQDLKPQPITEKNLTVVSSYTHAVTFGQTPILIGERINPTGKKKLKEALRSGNIGYVLEEGLAQAETPVQLLDVNVGLPEIDEPKMLQECVKQLQSVCDLPLQLDTGDAEALERGLRIYGGKAMINSVNGKAESMDTVFPLVKKYGGLVVCLTLDESGIPETAAGRFAIAEKIVRRAGEYGISPKDLIFDPLALTVASDQTAPGVTLETLSLIREKLGAHCSLGVSNVSFGLPKREMVTAAFFSLALSRGLSAAIIHPRSEELWKAYYSFMALSGQDKDCAKYIGFAQSLQETTVMSAPAKPVAAPVGEQTGSSANALQKAIIQGLRQQAGEAAKTALAQREPLALINEDVIPALDHVGLAYEKKTMFLPQLLMSAEAAAAAFAEIKQALPSGASNGHTVLLATVQGDIHDIGKNIVKTVLENYGYPIVDLGRDVAPEDILSAVKAQNIRLVGLSALMTTTVPAMEKTVALLHAEAPYCRVMVGGAVLTKEYAESIHADFYAVGAMDDVHYAAEVFQQKE